MPPAATDEAASVDMAIAYRHDIHKLRGRQHGSGRDELFDVAVNEPVPMQADRDAALLSRPDGEPEQTVANHASPARLSLLTGSVLETGAVPVQYTAITPLIDGSSDELHAAWLTSETAALVNESVYLPYSSLKYHVLVVAALLDAYRAGHAFDDLYLVAEPTPDGPPRNADRAARREAALDADCVVPHRTILWTEAVTMRLTASPDGPAAWLGPEPAESFADVWSRVSGSPLGREAQWWRHIDAQLRRIRSWSTALQYIEDAVAEDTRGTTEVSE
ncbi:hypothetical protein C463_12402 [Halorubrum californiense DSM 19288]|uniref:DUF8168 domain-containing protein n=1 Tax=Halorubrum californiense DSM 19288 TaxID=1227465 RepID=M0E3G7_9EURY|nr:hypothetical protein [Halorubrum californiense]ELZ41482.1 hypothetical protein C463_12402 [Halorubrum californiense DSM 19288]